MPRTDFALAGWKKKRPGKSYPPIPVAVAQAVAGRLCFMGDFRAGVALLLAFECYLRCGELLALRPEDVAFPDDVRIWSGLEGGHICGGAGPAPTRDQDRA
jgi:integrase